MKLESKGESQKVGMTQREVAGITVSHLITTVQLGKIHTVSPWVNEKGLSFKDPSV